MRQRRSQHVLVYRKGLEVCCELIDQESAFVLEKLRSGQPLGKMCEALAGETKDSSSVTRWFQEWTQKGLITALRSSPP